MTDTNDPTNAAELLDQLRDLVNGNTPAGRVTTAAYTKEQLASLAQRRKGTAGTYASGLRLLADGAHDLCECKCAACDGPEGCPCACGCDVDEAGEHLGRTRQDASEGEHHTSCTSSGATCASRWTGRGATAISALRLVDLEQGQQWARLKARRRARRRNRVREAEGRSMHEDDGKGGSENFVAATRWLLDRAVDEGLTTRNPAMRLSKPKRKKQEPRALSLEQLAQLFDTATSTGHDPIGDGLVLRFSLEGGPRRGGVLSARFGDVNTANATVEVREPKTDQIHTVPITPELAGRLVAHAIERGPRMAAPAGATASQRRQGIPVVAQSEPLLYRPPVDTFDAQGNFVSREVRPLTRKSLESLRERVKGHLSWADEMHFRLHDLRHTIGTMIERTAGHAVAKRHLGHSIGADTTGIYVVGTLWEDAAAIAAIFRCRHPLAPDDPA